MKKILLMAMVAGVLFACNKQDPAGVEDENATGKSSVTLSIQQKALSRGITDQIGDPEYAIISSGKIYFLNVSNDNIYQRELTAAEILLLQNTATDAGGNSITITGVPSSATALFFLANIKTTDGTGFPEVEGTGSADARLRIDKLQGNAETVPMSGYALFAPGVGANKTASVLLTPLVARVELGQVTCQNQNGAGAPALSSDITEYKLSGVFINNIAQSVLLNGTPYVTGSRLDIKAQSGWGVGSVDMYFMSTNTAFPYYLGGNLAIPANWVPNAMVDYCTPPDAGLTFYPDVTTGATGTDPGVTPKTAWAYQVTPGTTTTIGTSDPDVPHLILKLTEVAYTVAELGQAVQYVTVTKYKDAISGDAITTFAPGYVYRITNLIFTHNEATDEPYKQDISVTAAVTVAPWVVHNLLPDWN